LRDILTAIVRYERWSSVQVLGEVGAISKCFDRGHEMSPSNMIKWLKIQSKEVIASEILKSNGF
jgi:hypothetical protein